MLAPFQLLVRVPHVKVMAKPTPAFCRPYDTSATLHMQVCSKGQPSAAGSPAAQTNGARGAWDTIRAHHAVRRSQRCTPSEPLDKSVSPSRTSSSPALATSVQAGGPPCNVRAGAQSMPEHSAVGLKANGVGLLDGVLTEDVGLAAKGSQTVQ